MAYVSPLRNLRDLNYGTTDFLTSYSWAMLMPFGKAVAESADMPNGFDMLRMVCPLPLIAVDILLRQ